MPYYMYLIWVLLLIVYAAVVTGLCLLVWVVAPYLEPRWRSFWLSVSLSRLYWRVYWSLLKRRAWRAQTRKKTTSRRNSGTIGPLGGRRGKD